LAIEPDYCAGLYALAVCRLATGAAEQAVAPLEKLIHRDSRWANYRAWPTLVDVQLARGRPADALAACRGLEKRLPTLENKCLLAEHLLDNGIPSEAVQLLDRRWRTITTAPGAPAGATGAGPARPADCSRRRKRARKRE